MSFKKLGLAALLSLAALPALAQTQVVRIGVTPTRTVCVWARAGRAAMERRAARPSFLNDIVVLRVRRSCVKSGLEIRLESQAWRMRLLRRRARTSPTLCTIWTITISTTTTASIISGMKR